MILTGKKLDRMGRAVWGDDWIAIVSDRLHRARRTVARYRNDERGIPADFREDFIRLVDDQLHAIAAVHNELHDIMDDG